jgi:hypothetical protein
MRLESLAAGQSFWWRVSDLLNHFEGLMCASGTAMSGPGKNQRRRGFMELLLCLPNQDQTKVQLYT